MYTTEHLEAIDLRLSHERARAQTATGKEATWRWHNVAMIEKERENEVAFLLSRGVQLPPSSIDDISDDELLELLQE